MAGNAQMVRVAEQAATLIAHYEEWSAAAESARERLPEWQRLGRLVRHAQSLPVAGEVSPQVAGIKSQRTLLTDPNPIPPILSRTTVALRQAVYEAHERLRNERDREVAELEASDIWSKLNPGDAAKLLEEHRLGPIPGLDIGSEGTLLDCLEQTGIKDWADQVDALKTRVTQAREEAARLLAPKAVTVRPTPATLNNREDVETYVRALREQLLAQVDERPVIIP